MMKSFIKTFSAVILVVCIIASMTLSAFCLQFTDVKPDSWFYYAVEYVSEKGFITGYGNGMFGPGDKMQRQDFVIILARILQVNLNAYNNEAVTLKDVQKGSYYTPAIAWAVQFGIVSGYNNGYFGVGDSITREQLCTIIYRLFDAPSISNMDRIDALSKFSDQSRISKFALNAVAWCVSNGIITGKSDKTIAPVDDAGRAEVATIITRLDLNGFFDGLTPKEIIAQKINKATKTAVDNKSGYNWTRECSVTNLDFGGTTATGILNRLISSISSEDNVASVVGKYVGEGHNSVKVPKGKTLETVDIENDDGTTEKLYHGSNYTLKATVINAEDMRNLIVDGNAYEFDLVDSENPNRSGNTAFSRFCNDFAVRDEVESAIKGFTNAISVNSFNANYSSIHVRAVISNGTIKELIYSMKADTTLTIKVGISITGKISYEASAKYSNFSN